MNSKKSLVEKPKAKPKATKKVLVEKPKAKATTKKVLVEKPKAKATTKKVLVEKPKAKATTKKVLVEKPKAKPKATKKILIEKPKEKPKAVREGGGFFSSYKISNAINDFVTNSNNLYDAYDNLVNFLNDIKDYTNIDEDEKNIILKLLDNHLNDDLNKNFKYENITNTEYIKILNSSTFKDIILYINLIELSNKIYKSIESILNLSEEKDRVPLLTKLNNYTNKDTNKEARNEKILNIKKLLSQSDNTTVQKQDAMTTIPNSSAFDPSGKSGTSISAHAPLSHSRSSNTRDSETEIIEDADELLGIK